MTGVQTCALPIFADILDAGKTTKEVEMDVEQPTQGKEQVPTSLRLKYRLDTKRNVMTGSELYDRKTNKLLNKTTMLYRYNPQTKQENLQTVYNEEYAENPQTGRRNKRITTCQYKQFTLTNNLD